MHTRWNHLLKLPNATASCAFVAILFCSMSCVLLSKAHGGLPLNTAVGEFNGIAAYSNGSSSRESTEYNDSTGVITGYKWQCVEYVNRYYYITYGLQIRGGNGTDYYPNAANKHLSQYENNGTEPPIAGDILCFSGGGATQEGHVAIVREVSPDHIYVIQQNVTCTERDANYSFALTKGTGNKYFVDGSALNGSTSVFYCQGWLRAPSGPIPSQGQILAINTNGVCISGVNCTIDDKPLAKTGSNGRCDVPWYVLGWHQLTLQVGSLYKSLIVNFTGGQSNLQSSTKTLAAAQEATSNVYEIELASNTTCTGLGPVNSFAVGDRVEIYGTGNGLRARYPDPCSDAYAVMPDLSVGTVAGSWQCCNGYIRWKIRYDGLPGIDVWSAEAEPSTGQIFLRKKQNSTCSYSISPARLDLDTAGAAASSFIVNTGSSCYWNAAANSNWITITSNASGYGSKQVTFSVAVNTGPGSRVGQISVADQTFTITQAGANSQSGDGGILALGLNETFVAKDATGGSMAVYNKGGGTINWSASTTTSWLTVTTPTGTATVNGGTLSFTCQPNTAGSQRVGTIVVSAPGAAGSPQTLTFTQGGSDTASVTISNLAVPATASAGSNVSVTWSQNSPIAQSNVVLLLTLYPNGQSPEPRAVTKNVSITVSAGSSSLNTNYDLPSDLYSGPYDVEFSLWSDANHDGVFSSGDILLGTFRKAAAIYVNGVPPKPAPVTVSNLSIPPSASAGDNISVTWSDNSPYSQPNVMFRLTLYPAGQTAFRFDITHLYQTITIQGGDSSLNTTFQLPSNLYSGVYDAEISLWSDLDGDLVIGSGDTLLGSVKKSSVITVNGPSAPLPKLGLSSNNVGVGADAGATSLSVSNLGLGRLDWSASTTATWLSV